MRLRRLDLIRYGRFTDRTIDFGEKEAGRADFHVIHGPNEAGKSTLFSAWLDFLYGINSPSRYNFLHDYKTMRIGATIETGSGTRDLLRIKKPTASLLDSREQSVGDGLLQADLGGLDRDAYKTMFSLDETSLEQGGEAILASKGDVGQLLFSASAGLADLARRLDGIREETDRFHRPRAQKTELAELKHRLDQLKAQKEAIDVAANEHARLVADRDKARLLHDQANRRRAGLRVKLEASASRLASLPHLARLAGLRRDLDAMDVTPDYPSEWPESLPAIRRRDVELATAVARLDRDIALLDAAIAERPEPDPILAQADALEALRAPAGRALSEAQDLPNRLAERAASDRDIAGLVQRLGQPPTPNPSELVLPARVTGAVKSLIAEHARLQERFEAARREARTAEEALGAHPLMVAGAVEEGDTRDPEALERLADALSALRAVDLADRLSRSRKSEDAALEALARRMSPLAPWRGDRQALGALMPPPPAVLSDLGRRLSEAAAAVVRRKADCDGLAIELAGIAAEREAAAMTSGLISDAAAAQTRAARQNAWDRHRQSLDADSADRFLAAMQADDRIGEQRLSHVSELTRLRGFEQSEARLAARKTEAERVLAEVLAREQMLVAELEGLITATSAALSPAMGFAAFEAWCAAVAGAQASLEALVRAEADRREVETAIASAETRLAGALAGVGLDGAEGDLDQKIVLGRRFLEAETKRAAARASLQGLQAERDRRRSALDQVEADRKDWTESWAAALSGTWLAERETVASVAEVTEILDILQALGTALSLHDGLVDRIEKMHRDIAAFTARVSALAMDLGMGVGDDPHRLHRALVQRFEQASEDDAALRKDVARRAQLASERAELAEEHQALRARIEQMAQHFSVSSLDAVEAKMAMSARRRTLASEIVALEQEIADSLGAGEIGSVEAALDGVDRTELSAEIEALRPEIEVADDETKRAYAAFSAAEARLAELGSDGEAARLAAARRNVLLEIEDGARRYMSLRLGTLATDRALGLYRDRHQSSMMLKASGAFRALSRGNYNGLTTQRDGSRETLVALGADGGSKQATEMSKGTQFQLYLALRVAGYQEYAATRPPVPFIADDIMESFDEDRAAEALTQLAEMARSGQVIYLTHHQHICDIARSISADVSLHRL